jgi:hypothetical protein
LWRKLRSTFSCDSLKTLVTSRVRSREVTNAEYRASSHVVTHTVDNFSRHFLLFKKCASAYHFLAPPYCLHPHCHLPLSHHHHSLCPSQSRTATTAPPRRQIHCQSANLQQLFSGLMHGSRYKGWYTWRGQLTYLDDTFQTTIQSVDLCEDLF